MFQDASESTVFTDAENDFNIYNITTVPTI